MSLGFISPWLGVRVCYNPSGDLDGGSFTDEVVQETEFVAAAEGRTFWTSGPTR
jgi:hypothetical protein